jgi:hypothetical protein
MRKIILLALLALTFSACEFNTTEEVAPRVYTETYTVEYRDWTQGNDALGIHYYCRIRESNLTNEVFDYGVMQAFFFSAGRVLIPLPFSDFRIINGYEVEEYFTVEFEPGYVTFVLRTSDQVAELPRFESYDFSVTFLW